MTLFSWSTTAASNNTADSTINWREGQAPATVNNSARAMMAAVAKFRNDLSGMTDTAGSSTAYTFASSQGYSALSDGITVTARLHTTSGAAPTLNVDSLGAKAIRVFSATALPTGALSGGSIHRFTYDSGDDVWYVHNYFSDSFNATTAPDLNAIEALSTTGILRRSGAATWSTDAGLGHLATTTADRLVGTNGSGAVGVATVTSPLAYSSSALSVGAASDSATGVIEVAVQSEMETATSTTLAVTPGRQFHHPVHPKAGGHWSAAPSAGAFDLDFGMGAITYHNAGDFSFAFDTAFSSENYWVVAMTSGSLAQSAAPAKNTSRSKTTTVFPLANLNFSSNNADTSDAGFIAFGDYA